MRHLILKLVVLPVFFYFTYNTAAQSSLQGNVTNWTQGESLIVYFGMFNDEMTKIGTISEDGTMNIPLDPDYLNSFREIAEKEAANAPQGWSMSYKTLATTFPCLNEESAVTINGEAIVSGLPQLFLTDPSGFTELGILYAASSIEVATWLKSYGMESVIPGYYLEWLFMEEEGFANGKCVTPTYTGNDSESYEDTYLVDVKLQKGWNMIKYEITDVFTSKTGKTYPSKTLVSRVENLPEDIQWLAIGN
ncbi:hypothetical protein FHG64_08470 [Antarcticibacterium flavum]|uniref:GLPGLI family protein n=1 Tax=Antarcticibacterium flavum TaxID=2058175 RepID=A0A5B7X480_9FLAO|nr:MULTISPECIES: hypothetical protein [Antarcticibacterium]MCM4161346.1 hypothetical protein [Antarcticibacterium sp. W02-3]QCY69423.1 hypothetical protein FHG64_08470 [Antarcticibacterium flavum]